jgi:cytochrome c biogenesis protein CcdA/thiol-disulfide isomerase/thioredoxin
MILALAVFLGGVLTILSPCILPVLPFVFARADQKFLRNGVPLLVGMAVTFAGIATLAAVGGSWAIRLNQYGRIAALVLLAAFALTLVSRTLADWLSRPFVALGNQLSARSSEGTVASLLLGVATGLLWAPCAGPILGLILTGAALSGPSAHTTLLLFVYAAGAATSLALALLAGGRVFAALKRSLGAGEWIRRIIGVLVLAGVVVIAFGFDSTVLTRSSLAGTNSLEETLLHVVRPGISRRPSQGPMGVAADGAMPPAIQASLPIEGDLPPLTGATLWLNSPPLTPQALRGKVVLIDFWTYSCINCLRALPHLETWYDKYKDHGLVVLGVHAPEFAFERDPANVRRAVGELKIAYPVALDNDYAIWKAFNNEYWPAHYFIDAEGHIRAHHFGEGGYEASEQTIRGLLMAAGYTHLPPVGGAPQQSAGIEMAADETHNHSWETYIGYRRAQGFASPQKVAPDRTEKYASPKELALNQWALAGLWQVEAEKAVLKSAPGKIVFRFHARDLHLVLGAGEKPVHIRVELDGAPPKDAHGVDIDASGEGLVTNERLYQLIRQTGEVAEHTFSIEFLDGDVSAYSFTFG